MFSQKVSQQKVLNCPSNKCIPKQLIVSNLQNQSMTDRQTTDNSLALRVNKGGLTKCQTVLIRVR